MIDKKIAYCWFGHGEMSELNKKCMETWKQVCPDYEIIEINEESYDYKSNPYAKEAYENKDWSGVSNAARLWWLKNNNGFYLDTDVRLIKSLDLLREYDGGFITEFDTGQPDSGILGRGSVFPDFFEEAYERLKPGTILHKEFLQLLYSKYDVHGERVRTYKDGFTVLGEEYIPTIRTGLFTENTIALHYFENTWADIKRNVTDGFYPFPRCEVYVGGNKIKVEKDATVKFKVKHINKKWTDADMIGRIDYFFNPKVVKMSCGLFEAERINYDSLATQKHTITPSGMIVTYIDKTDEE